MRRILVLALLLLPYPCQAASQPELIPQLGWPGSCYDQAWTPDGREMVGLFGGPKREIVRWDTHSWETKSIIALPKQPSYPFTDSAALSPNARYAAVALPDGTMKIVEAATGKTLFRFEANDYAFSPDSSLLAARRRDQASVYAVPGGEVRSSIKLPSVVNYGSGVAISPDNRVLATVIGKRAFLWDLKTGERLRTLTHDAEMMSPVVFSPDGRYLAVEGDDPEWEPPDFAATEAAYARTYQVLLWDVRTGRRIFRRPDHDSLDGGTEGLFFTDRGRKLLSCGMHQIDTWSIPSGGLLSNQQGPPRGFWAPFALSPDGRTLAAGPARYSLPSFKLNWRFPQYWTYVDRIAFSSDGHLLSAQHTYGNTDGPISIWNLGVAKVERWITPAAWASIAYIDFCRDSHSLVTFIYANSIQLYDADTGDLLREVTAPVPKREMLWSRLSPDCGTLVGAVNSGNQWELHVWDAETLELRCRITPCPSSVGSGAFSADGRFFATGTHSPARLYDLQTGTARELPGIVEPISLSNDGSRLVGLESLGTQEQPSHHWTLMNLQSGTRMPLAPLEGRHYDLSAAFSPDSTMVAVPLTAGIGLYTVKDGARIRTIAPDDVAGPVAFHPSGRLIAAAGDSGVRLYDVNTGEQVLTLLDNPPGPETHLGAFWLAYAPDSCYTGSAGIEKRIRWRSGGELFSGERYAAEFSSPERVQGLLETH